MHVYTPHLFVCFCFLSLKTKKIDFYLCVCMHVCAHCYPQRPKGVRIPLELELQAVVMDIRVRNYTCIGVLKDSCVKGEGL